MASRPSERENMKEFRMDANNKQVTVFIKLISAYIPCSMLCFRAAAAPPIKTSRSENVVVHNPEMLTRVSSLLIQRFLFPAKASTGKISCLRARCRLVEHSPSVRQTSCQGVASSSPFPYMHSRNSQHSSYT